MKRSFEATLIDVWRQALVENAKAVELGAIDEDGHKVKGCLISPDYGGPRFVTVWLAAENPIEFYL